MDAATLPCGRIGSPCASSGRAGPSPRACAAPAALRISKFGTVTLESFRRSSVCRRRAEGQVGTRWDGARAYRENTNAVVKFLRRVQGALPVIGLISRLASPEGGVGTDRIRFDEFCTRVGRSFSRDDSRAFYDIAARHGKSAKPPFVLIWCWAAAVGAGLLRSGDLLMGASRLRVSYDIQYEVENFDLLMDESTKKREKSGSKVPDVPMEARAEKALEAICKCCTGTTKVLEEDAPLFATILKVVFPTANKEEIDYIVASRLFDPAIAPASPSVDESVIDDDDDDDVEETQGDEGKPDDDDGADSQPQSVAHELLQ